MLGCSSILAIALFTLANGNHGKHQRTPSAALPGVPAMQKQLDHEAILGAKTLSKMPQLAVNHMADRSFRQISVPEIKHKKKPGQGYEKGSPLFEKQQKRKQTEMLLPPSPSGRQRPKLTIILGCMFVGIMVLLIAGCINRDFLVRRHWDTGDLPSGISPPPIKQDFDIGRQPPATTSTRYDLNPGFQPVRAQVEYVDAIPKSTRLGLDATMPPTSPQQVALPQPRFGEPSVSMMPSKQQYPSMQKLGQPPQYASMQPPGNSPPGSQGIVPPQSSTSPSQQNFMQNTAPPGAMYSMPPQQPSSYLPPPRSSAYASMPPVVN